MLLIYQLGGVKSSHVFPPPHLWVSWMYVCLHVCAGTFVNICVCLLD